MSELRSASRVALAALATVTALAACGDDSTNPGTGGGGGTGGATSTSTGATSQASTGAPASSASSGSGAAGTGGEAAGTGGEAAGTGGDAGSGGAGPGSGGGHSGGGTGSGGEAESFPDDCATADDCPGGDCVEVAVGFRACLFPLVEATECTGKADQCCDSEDCEALGGGTCTTLPDASQCGGASPVERNVCSGDSDCIDCAKSGAICLAAGFYGYNQGQCVSRHCFGDDDCSDEDGGRCVPVFEQCCGAVAGFFCAYPSDGCRADSDCGEDHCEGDPATGRAACAEGTPICPP